MKYIEGEKLANERRAMLIGMIKEARVLYNQIHLDFNKNHKIVRQIVELYEKAPNQPKLAELTRWAAISLADSALIHPLEKERLQVAHDLLSEFSETPEVKSKLLELEGELKKLSATADGNSSRSRPSKQPKTTKVVTTNQKDNLNIDTHSSAPLQEQSPLSSTDSQTAQHATSMPTKPVEVKQKPRYRELLDRFGVKSIVGLSFMIILICMAVFVVLREPGSSPAEVANAPSNVAENEQEMLHEPALSIAQSVTNNLVTINDRLLFNVIITNTGQTWIDQIVVKPEQVPAGLNVDAWQSQLDRLGALEPGQSQQISLPMQVQTDKPMQLDISAPLEGILADGSAVEASEASSAPLQLEIYARGTTSLPAGFSLPHLLRESPGLGSNSNPTKYQLPNNSEVKVLGVAAKDLSDDNITKLIWFELEVITPDGEAIRGWLWNKRVALENEAVREFLIDKVKTTSESATRATRAAKSTPTVTAEVIEPTATVASATAMPSPTASASAYSLGLQIASPTYELLGQESGRKQIKLTTCLSLQDTSFLDASSLDANTMLEVETKLPAGLSPAGAGKPEVQAMQDLNTSEIIMTQRVPLSKVDPSNALFESIIIVEWPHSREPTYTIPVTARLQSATGEELSSDHKTIEVEPIPHQPALSISQSVTNKLVTINDTLSFNVTITNSGQTWIDQLVVKPEQVPAGLNVDAWQSELDRLGALEPGQSQQISLPMQVQTDKPMQVDLSIPLEGKLADGSTVEASTAPLQLEIYARGTTSLPAGFEAHRLRELPGEGSPENPTKYSPPDKSEVKVLDAAEAFTADGTMLYIWYELEVITPDGEAIRGWLWNKRVALENEAVREYLIDKVNGD